MRWYLSQIVSIGDFQDFFLNQLLFDVVNIVNNHVSILGNSKLPLIC